MFWRKKRPLGDLEEEINAHLAIEAGQLRETAGPHVDTEAAARRAFGNTTIVKEAFYENSHWMFRETFSRNMRHALLLSLRRPAFSAVVVSTLAVGIGATLAIFSVVNAVLLRPLPYRDPARLAMLWSEDSAHGLHEGRVSLLNFADWKNSSHTFEDMTLFIGQTFLLGGQDGTRERMRSARVPAKFFPLLGVEPALGRSFSLDEERRGDAVVVLSNRLWLQRFAGSPNVLGNDLIMDGRKSRIIGVMPPSFQFPFPDTQVWEPLTAHPYWAARDRASPREASNWYVLGVFAKPRPGQRRRRR